MKKLLLSLMVLASLVSCGKDSKSNNLGTSNGITIGSTSISNTDPAALHFGNFINRNYFVQLPPNATEFKYKTTSSDYSCVQKEGWLGIDYEKCKTTTNSTNSTIPRSSISLDAKKQLLIDIVNASSPGNIKVIGPEYHIKTTDGKFHIININYPLEVNPVLVQEVNFKVTYFSNYSN